MKFTGKVESVGRDWQTDRLNITFSVNERSAETEIDKIWNEQKLSIEAVKKWEVYLLMLKRYGKFTYICVKPNVVEAVKAQWRECEEVGKISLNGQDAVQLICYFGSSTYNTQEMSVLLDGVISEMKEIGLQPPMSSEMKRALEEWDAEHNNK